MTKISFNKQKVIIEIEGIDKILALKSSIEIPIEHILSVSKADDIAKKWLGIKSITKIKIGGTQLPGVITEGTFYDKGRVFLDIHHPENTILLSLRNDKYKEIIIEVKDRDNVINEISQYIK